MKEELAIRLKAYRTLMGMSQKALAEAAGLSVATICHIEQGKDASTSTFDKIEKALGVTLI